MPHYAVLDPRHLLSDDTLRIYELVVGRYRPGDAGPWPDVGLGLRLWEGRFEGVEDIWLRWCDANGAIIPTGEERAAQLAEHARQADERAALAVEQARQADERIRQLEAELRRFGITVRQHLPGVGCNFHDHTGFSCVWEFRGPQAPNVLVDTTVYWKSGPKLQSPDMFLCEAAFPLASPENAQRFGLPEGSWGFLGAISRPQSRGRIRLTGPNPDEFEALAGRLAVFRLDPLSA